MTSPREYADYLRDILETAEKARQFVAGINYDEFTANDEKIFAVTRALEIIGEAARGIPEDIRGRYPQIPWRSVAGTRDKLIHGYFEVDPSRVWETVQNDLPPLILVVKQMLADVESSARE